MEFSLIFCESVCAKDTFYLGATKSQSDIKFGGIHNGQIGPQTAGMEGFLTICSLGPQMSVSIFLENKKLRRMDLLGSFGLHRLPGCTLHSLGSLAGKTKRRLWKSCIFLLNPHFKMTLVSQLTFFFFFFWALRLAELWSKALKKIMQQVISL